MLKVFLIGAGNVVGAREALLGTHIQIVVRHVIEHCGNAGYRGNLDRAGRQTLISVGVVRTVDLQEFVVYASECKVL